MKGFYISEENAKKLGLLQNAEIAPHLQKTIIVIAENDLLEKGIEIDEKNTSEYANWFYENYYDGILESFASEL